MGKGRDKKRRKEKSRERRREREAEIAKRIEESKDRDMAVEAGAQLIRNKLRG